jgi:hypothetical protein
MMSTAEIISPILPELLTDEEIKCLQDRPEHTSYVQQLEMDTQQLSTTDVLTTRRLTQEIESRGRDKPWIYWTTLIAVVILMNVISVVFLVKWRSRQLCWPRGGNTNQEVTKGDNVPDAATQPEETRHQEATSTMNETSRGVTIMADTDQQRETARQQSTLFQPRAMIQDNQRIIKDNQSIAINL